MEWILLIIILGVVVKLIYNANQHKQQINELDKTAKDEADRFREQWQTIAGIKPHNKEAAPFNPHNNKLNENIIDELKNDFQNSKFPKPDETINVRTTKITTIDTNFGSDNDPLVSIPMSRVSKAAKQKMADIAKEDITKQLEQNAERLVVKPIELDVPTKPKRKYNKKPKQ